MTRCLNFLFIFWPSYDGILVKGFKFDYIELTFLINVSQILGLFSMRYWGKRIDKMDYSAIRLTSFYIAFTHVLGWYLLYA